MKQQQVMRNEGNIGHIVRDKREINSSLLIIIIYQSKQQQQEKNIRINFCF